MLVTIIWIFGYSVNWMYTGFGIILCAAVMLPTFSAAKILPNPKLKNKRKIFIQGRSKQYGFASQEFLVVRGNGLGISVEWPAHPPLVGGGGVSYSLFYVTKSRDFGTYA